MTVVALGFVEYVNLRMREHRVKILGIITFYGANKERRKYGRLRNRQKFRNYKETVTTGTIKYPDIPEMEGDVVIGIKTYRAFECDSM